MTRTDPGYRSGVVPERLRVGDWRDRAACSRHADPDLWLSDKADDQDEAIDVCSNYCTVRRSCLTYHMAVESGQRLTRSGVAGGYTGRQRVELGKRLRRLKEVFAGGA